MENTRIGKAEAIALILTIMANHAILNISKSIISTSQSSSLLNTIYISIIALIVTYIIYLLLKKFPTFDILDISNFLGGKVLKTIMAVLFLSYFVFFSANLLKNFAYCLQIIYYPNTNTFFIIAAFLFAAVFVCNLKYNAIYRSNLLTIPFVIFNLIVILLGNSTEFTFQNIFPILGNGINETFLLGISNLFAFQGILYILFLPPHLKDITDLRKITLLSILFSALYLVVSVAIILFMFDIEVNNTLLMPLYSAVKYIEFGTFFQRLDSIFILTWIVSFVSYLSITINICCNIIKKVTHLKSNKLLNASITLLILCVSFFSTTYAISTFIVETVYKYVFFIILGISMLVLISAYIFMRFKHKKFNNNYNRSKNLLGGAS